MPRIKDADPNYEKAMKLFHGECILCGATFGVTIHEIVPKSLNPKGWMELSNRVPLCQTHHTYVHSLPKKDREPLLYQARDRALKLLRQS